MSRCPKDESVLSVTNKKETKRKNPRQSRRRTSRFDWQIFCCCLLLGFVSCFLVRPSQTNKDVAIFISTVSVFLSVPNKNQRQSKDVAIFILQPCLFSCPVPNKNQPFEKEFEEDLLSLESRKGRRESPSRTRTSQRILDPAVLDSIDLFQGFYCGGIGSVCLLAQAQHQVEG